MPDQDYTNMTLPQVIAAAIANFYGNGMFPSNIAENDKNRIEGEIATLENKEAGKQEWIDSLTIIIEEYWELKAIADKEKPCLGGPGMKGNR